MCTWKVCILELVHLHQWLLKCIYSIYKAKASMSLYTKLYKKQDGRVEKCIHLAISPRRIFKRTVSAISSALCPVATLSTFNNAAPRSRALEIKQSINWIKSHLIFITDKTLTLVVKDYVIIQQKLCLIYQIIVCMPSANPQSQVSATNSINGRASRKYMMNICVPIILEEVMSYTWRRKTPQNVQLFFKPIIFTISSIVHPYKSLYETILSGSPYWKWNIRIRISHQNNRKWQSKHIQKR